MGTDQRSTTTDIDLAGVRALPAAHAVAGPDATDLPAGAALALARAGRLTLHDVRKAPARQGEGRALVGAAWSDPSALGHGRLPPGDGPLGLFCVHGHEVSRFAAALCRLHGREAYVVAGGFAALTDAGAPLVPLGADDAAPHSTTDARALVEGTATGGRAAPVTAPRAPSNPATAPEGQA
ncbi:MAG: hypothetical protein AAF677_11870 [Pseudomonadota bacterium]